MTDPYRIRTDETWAEARGDYLNGFTAEEVCRRHDIGLSALRKRARREGWRRTDCADPPVDDDLDLFDDVAPSELLEMARLRMVAAVSRGQSAEAARWRRFVSGLLADLEEARWREPARPASRPTSRPQDVHEVHPKNSAPPSDAPVSRQVRRHLERQAAGRS